MRWSLVFIASAALLAGCTPAPQPVSDDDDLVPHELIQQYTMSCAMVGYPGTEGGFRWSVGGRRAVVITEIDSPANREAAHQIEECLNRYHYEDGNTLAFVPAYERAQLYEYYETRTRPCLADLGVDVPDHPRSEFFTSDERVWNPYPAMDDIPFDELLSLYRACPPVPDYVLSRHVTFQAGG